MSTKGAQLSNPFSTGGGGSHFENFIQSAFTVLLLSQGVAPCLRPWPIVKIQVQGKYDGYSTDDFIVYVEENGTGQQAKLLAQIKHSLSITENDPTFQEVIAAAWQDFNNTSLFTPGIDVIALITGPLSAHDIENARTILDWARTCATADEFLKKVNETMFSSDPKRSKLKAFKVQLKRANQGNDVSDDQLWRFLKSYHLLGYDLDAISGVTLSLLKSHISQHGIEDIDGVWSRVAQIVQGFNQRGGTITRETLPQELCNAFKAQSKREEMPAKLAQPGHTAKPDPSKHFVGEQAEALKLAVVLGAWSEKTPGDKDIIDKLINK